MRTFEQYLNERIKKDPSLRGRLDEARGLLDLQQLVWDCARSGDVDGWEEAMGELEVKATTDGRREALESLIKKSETSTGGLITRFQLEEYKKELGG